MTKDEQQQSCHPEVPEAGQLKGWIATLTTFVRNDRKRAAFTLAEVPEARQYGSKRAAFTLAEVLITLGIIGVVAAMTIPTLMKNYQTRVLDMKFKKTYSVLTNALNMARVDYDYIPRCYYPSNVGNYSSGDGRNATVSDCSQFLPAFYNSLKVLKLCQTRALANGCIPEYEGYDTVVNSFHPDQAAPDGYATYGDWVSRGCGNFKKNSILNYNSAYVLQDGTIILPYGLSNASMPLFAVDINGMQGPNKWGYDLFPFTIFFNGNSLYLGNGGCSQIEKGGRSTTMMITNVVRK